MTLFLYPQLVCSRFNYHLHPKSDLHHSDGVSSHGGSQEYSFDLEAWQEGFKPLHTNMRNSMYFL